MPQMTNPETLRGKLRQMREDRDFWRDRAKKVEAELRVAARCVRALLKVHGEARKWLKELL